MYLFENGMHSALRRLTGGKRGLKKGYPAMVRRWTEAEVGIGQRFRKTDATQIVIWEVADVFKGTDGRPYVELVRVGDRSLRKTLAAAALGQSNQYVAETA
jgi:hypothetical protein